MSSIADYSCYISSTKVSFAAFSFEYSVIKLFSSFLVIATGTFLTEIDVEISGDLYRLNCSSVICGGLSCNGR